MNGRNRLFIPRYADRIGSFRGLNTQLWQLGQSIVKNLDRRVLIFFKKDSLLENYAFEPSGYRFDSRPDQLFEMDIFSF